MKLDELQHIFNNPNDLETIQLLETHNPNKRGYTLGGVGMGDVRPMPSKDNLSFYHCGHSEHSPDDTLIFGTILKFLNEREILAYNIDEARRFHHFINCCDTFFDIELINGSTRRSNYIFSNVLVNWLANNIDRNDIILKYSDLVIMVNEKFSIKFKELIKV